MRYHLFQNFFGKMVEIKKTSFHSTREDTNFLPPLYDVYTRPYNGLVQANLEISLLVWQCTEVL